MLGLECIGNANEFLNRYVLPIGHTYANADSTSQIDFLQDAVSGLIRIQLAPKVNQ